MNGARTIDIETEVIRMGDVGVAIDMVDTTLAEGDADKAERAVVILKEIFVGRYGKLRQAMAGGDDNA